MTRSIHEFSIEGEQAPPDATAYDGKASTSSGRRTVFDDDLVVYRRDVVLAGGGDTTINVWTALDRFGVAMQFQIILMLRIWIDKNAGPLAPLSSYVRVRSTLTGLGTFPVQDAIVADLAVGSAIQWDYDPEAPDGEAATPWVGGAGSSEIRLTEENGEGPVTVSIEMWCKR